MAEARFAIVTPYYKEERAILERCLTSVKAQTRPADHIVVADGFPQDWIDGAGVRHLRLDRAHGDFGNAARGLGAMLAVAETYDGIGFIDADNWLDRDHVARCVVVGSVAPRPDFVVAKRRFVRPDGPDFRMVDEPGFIDTNCWWFQPGAYHTLSYWVTIPREMSPIGDRVFSGLVDRMRLTCRYVTDATVNYTCLLEGVCRRFGETPPPDAKPGIDLMPVLEWMCALTDEKRRTVAKLCAGDLVPWARQKMSEMKSARPKP